MPPHSAFKLHCFLLWLMFDSRRSLQLLPQVQSHNQIIVWFPLNNLITGLLLLLGLLQKSYFSWREILLLRELGD